VFDIIIPEYAKGETFFTSAERPGYTATRILNEIGYTKACNAGIALSTAPYVVLLNSDATPKTEGWLEKMAACFDAGIAAVGPITDNPKQGQGRPDAYPPNTGFIQLEPTSTDAGWGWNVHLSFFCVMICREALVDVGYLDERFSPGGGEDDDWLYRAYLKGWGYGVQTDVLVSHVGQASWESLEPLPQRSERAHRLLREKYPKSA
jgi:O-antigen biosynthesis protein